jgi:hypothetical protein
MTAEENTNTGLGPIPDPESKTSGEEMPTPKKRGRKPGTSNGGAAKKKAVEAVAVQTTCSVKMRYRLHAGEKLFEVQTGGKATTPQQAHAMFLRWAREIENRWAKL